MSFQPIAEDEKNDLREILRNFYGNQVDSWNITLESFELFGELIAKTKACDVAMNFVPRPYIGGSVIKWATKEIRQAITRHFLKPENKHYIICMKVASYSMKTKFVLAQHGI